MTDQTKKLKQFVKEVNDAPDGTVQTTLVGTFTISANATDEERDQAVIDFLNRKLKEEGEEEIVINKHE